MFGFLVFCVIVFFLYQKAKKENGKNVKRKKNLFETTKEAQVAAPKNSNRALKSMRQSADGKKADRSREMPIEQRRRQQKEASDRSRIHQSLHEKEQKEQQLKQQQKNVETKAQVVREEIRFEDGQLMDEVYTIMACGYPATGSGQRDFLKEGMALLDRYHCA